MRRAYTATGQRKAALAVSAAAFFAAVISAPVPAGATPTEADIRAALRGDGAVDYRIHAIRVGTAADAGRGLFIDDSKMPRRIEVTFSLWVLRGGNRVILIDTGFTNRGMVEKWRISGYRDPVDGLSTIGVAPDDVTDVIVTHTHWDHIGGLSRFSKARIWIAEKELRAVKRRHRGRLPKAFSSATREGRLAVTRSVEAIAPSVVVVPVGLHTEGCQLVVVKNPDGMWIFASDVAPLYANFERRRPTGQTNDPKRTLEVQEVMRALVDGALDRIIPGHDPRVLGGKDVVELTGTTL